MKSYKGSRSNPKLQLKILDIFKSHIGEENAISGEQLFKEIYNIKLDKTNVRHLYAVKNIQSRISKLRHKSFCFIQCKTRHRKSGLYFIPKRFSESSNYAQTLSKGIANRVKTVEYAQESVKDRNYNKRWVE